MSVSAWNLVRTRALPSVPCAVSATQPARFVRAYSSSSSSRASTSTRGLKPKSTHDQLCSERAINDDPPNNNTHRNPNSNLPVVPGSKSAKTASSNATPTVPATSTAPSTLTPTSTSTPTMSTMTPAPNTATAPVTANTATPIDPITGLSKMFLASPVAARLKDKEAALRQQQAETAKSLPAMAGLLATAQRFDSTERQQTSLLRRAAAGALPWAPSGGQHSYLVSMPSSDADADEGEEELQQQQQQQQGQGAVTPAVAAADLWVEAHPIPFLPDPEDLPLGSKLRTYLSLCEFDQATVDNTKATFKRLADLQALETNQRYVEHVGARLRWDRAIRLADEQLGRGTLLDTPYPEIDSSQLDARLPLDQSAALWLDSTRRKRKSKMRKHKHRKLLKKMRARKIRQGRIRA